MSDYVMRQATENDLRAIEILLEANDLPNIHLAPYIKQFMVVETDDNVLIGVIGLHTTGKKALLRSFAVSVSRRNCGIGLMLVQHVFEQLQQKKYENVYLLTQTAKEYFIHLGFKLIARSEMPQELLVQSGLDMACPSSSSCLQYNL
ncbi:hypothetical protein SDC9_35173 [bioreactor metagenome]|uniref:N-acetyltransferase domain-containing protein n=1 Tax=bioreactor metagenome TaxID=1076179 RepID=A0A644VCY2_9ZZZZ|nr:GNAT family N-acetyltransferase [Acidaminococcaceae bacterium]